MLLVCSDFFPGYRTWLENGLGTEAGQWGEGRSSYVVLSYGCQTKNWSPGTFRAHVSGEVSARWGVGRSYTETICCLSEIHQTWLPVCLFAHLAHTTHFPSTGGMKTCSNGPVRFMITEMRPACGGVGPWTNTPKSNHYCVF